MLHLLILLISTIIIFFLGYKIYARTKDLSFILGLGLIYYWTLAGAWFFIPDGLHIVDGKSMGLGYYYLFQKMFYVYVDNYYLQTIILYSVFIIFLEIILLLVCIRKKTEIKTIKPMHINNYFMMVICIISVVASFFILKEDIFYAIKWNKSIYLITRHTTNRFYSIHQIFNLIAILSVFIGFVIYLPGKDSKYIISRHQKVIMPIFIFLIILVELYFSILGNKHEIFFSGIFILLLYFYNTIKRNMKHLVYIILIILIPLILNDAMRKYSATILHLTYIKIYNYSGKSMDTDNGNQYEGININLNKTIRETYLNMILNNEMFCGHFSLYGVLKNDISITKGSSIIYLMKSFVPRLIIQNRPKDIYSYYAESLHLKPDQGYTINHATAWYLNFGIFGIFLGSGILGLLWGFVYNKFHNLVHYKNTFIYILCIISYSGFVAELPNIIRNGPEAYKDLLFSALFLPAIIIYLAYITERQKELI